MTAIIPMADYYTNANQLDEVILKLRVEQDYSLILKQQRVLP